jgi:hypothetical protein
MLVSGPSCWQSLAVHGDVRKLSRLDKGCLVTDWEIADVVHAVRGGTKRGKSGRRRGGEKSETAILSDGYL